MNLELLRYDLPTIMDIENLADKGFGQLWQEAQSLSFRAIVLVLWGGLKWQDHKLSPAAVAKQLQDYILSGHSFIDVVQDVTKAVDKSGLFEVFMQAEG